jgi:hypothetical protein
MIPVVPPIAQSAVLLLWKIPAYALAGADALSAPFSIKSPIKGSFTDAIGS